MSSWNEFVTAALLGTERAKLPPLPEELSELLGSESKLLASAGAIALWRRCGWKPKESADTLLPARPETLPVLNRTSAAHLRQMLDGNYSGVLPEWLKAVAEIRRRIPFELIPALLKLARQRRELRSVAVAAGGQRADWLASLNPEWNFASTVAEDSWETGSRDQRVAYLQRTRVTTPAEARVKIQSTWKEEGADVRTRFLQTLETSLSMEDEPFLESVLDDRSKEVRRAAIELLSTLPESRLVQRMIERATLLVKYKPGKLLSRASLEVTLPDLPDPAGVRDGLDPKAFGHQKQLGEKAVLLAQILSSVPPVHWEKTLSAKPQDFLKAAEKQEFALAIGVGLGQASVHFRAANWAEALLDSKLERGPFVPDEMLVRILPKEKVAEWLLAQVNAGVLRKRDVSGNLIESLTRFTEPWPDPLARAVIQQLNEVIHWHYRDTLAKLANRIPLRLIPEAIPALSQEQKAAVELAGYLQFRHEAITELEKQAKP